MFFNILGVDKPLAVFFKTPSFYLLSFRFLQSLTLIPSNLVTPRTQQSMPKIFLTTLRAERLV